MIFAEGLLILNYLDSAYIDYIVVHLSNNLSCSCYRFGLPHQHVPHSSLLFDPIKIFSCSFVVHLLFSLLWFTCLMCSRSLCEFVYRNSLTLHLSFNSYGPGFGQHKTLTSSFFFFFFFFHQIQEMLHGWI